MYPTILIPLIPLILATSAQTTTITGTDSCINPSPGPSGPPDPSLTWPTYITSGPAHPSNTVPVSPKTAATPHCEHAADPDGSQGYCPDVSDAGWCECDDGNDYPVISSGKSPCAYSTLPATPTVLQSTGCKKSAASTSTSSAASTSESSVASTSNSSTSTSKSPASTSK
ncbi:hypothetical protein ACLMJK_002787 [Lecanora helva]